MQSNKNFYEGQKIFIGIDVHARQWHAYASPISSLGTKAVCMPPSAEALLAYLQNKFPGGEYYSAYESGFCGFTKHRELLEIGINNIVFNASDLKKSNKERVRKTDAVDCKSIWENLSKGQLTAIYVPSEQEEEDRELVRSRESYVKDIRRVKQRIAMFLHKLDTAIPKEFIGKQGYWSRAYVTWLSAYKDTLAGGNKYKLESFLNTLSHLISERDNLEKQMQLAIEARHKEMSELLMTIPGIGPLSAAKICLELMNFSRFANDRHLAGYIGIVPDCYSSDTRGSDTGTTTRRNKILRSTLVEASWKAISKDPVLGSIYAKKCAHGKQANVAIMAIARKMVTRIFYVYRTRKPYVIGKT